MPEGFDPTDVLDMTAYFAAAAIPGVYAHHAGSPDFMAEQALTVGKMMAQKLAALKIEMESGELKPKAPAQEAKSAPTIAPRPAYTELRR